ncbi:MAG: molybdopterin-dependent oxidoreductase, partial [Geobacteraceae bacterium]|nr:molybdopterin-dependent oxidoreductase [Geobacteraceae bacterium]
VTYPESQRWRKALQKVEYLVVQDILESELTAMANVVLPAASFAEKSGTYIACDNTAGLLRQALKPCGNARTDVEILASLYSAATGKVAKAYPAPLRAELNDLCGLFEALKVSGDKYLSPGVKKAYKPAPAGLSFSEFKSAKPASAKVLVVGKMHAHTGVTSTYAPGALEIAPRGYIEINTEDAAKAGVKDGDKLTLTSAVGSFSALVRVSTYIPAGILFAPYHFADMNAMQAIPATQRSVDVEIAAS